MKPLLFFLVFTVAAFGKTLDISREDTALFPGWVSLAPEEIYLALKHCEFEETFSIIEFGAGEGTTILSDLLREKEIPFDYHTFENDKTYVFDLQGVTYHYYDLPDLPWGEPMNAWAAHIHAYDMPELPIADLIIIDGPHGLSRTAWYPKCKPFIRPGTILLIDDFHHLSEFAEALDQNFIYETIIEYNQDPRWNIINEGIESSPNLEIGKTFKIVKIIH